MRKIKIVITMAGKSKRFTDVGYSVPKYMLEINGKTIFEYAVESFKNYFNLNDFLFITLADSKAEQFIKDKCEKIGLHFYQIVTLYAPTKGQADTVIKGFENTTFPESTSFIIFNIDTFRPNFSFPSKISKWDGYLEVFKGSGLNWSYAKPKRTNSTKVSETAEKREISDLCSTGLYYFKTFKMFKDAYNEYISNNEFNEIYVAPIYNVLIKNNKEIHYNLIDTSEVVFCGTPKEYLQLCENLK